MITKSLHLLIALTWVASSILAFSIVSSRSESAPLPATATITVTTWTGSATLAGLRISLEDYANSEQITFAQEIADFGDRGAIRHLYLVDGDPQVPGSVWLAGGMGDFGDSISTVVHPLNEVGGRTPLGSYEVFGDSQKALKLASFFSSQGMTTESTEISAVGSVPRPILLTAGVMALLFVAMVAAFVVGGTRRYTIGRLHGRSNPALWLNDLRRFAPTWAVAGAVTMSLSSVAVMILYGTTGIGRFLTVTVAIQLALLLFASAAHAIVIFMVTSVEMLPALKGDLPATALSVTAYGLRLVAVVITLVTVVATLDLASSIRARDESREAFDQLDGVSSITLGNAYTPEDQDDLAATVGQWLREVDSQNRLLLSAQQVIASNDREWNGVNMLIVNEQFLADQPVRLSGGGTLQAESLDEIVVVVPSNRWEARSRLGPDLEIDAQVNADANLNYKWARAESSQRFFTYTPASESSSSPQVWDTTTAFVTDPILVVMPSTQGWLTDNSYSAFASQGGALFQDSQTVTSAVDQDPELERFVRGVTPIADRAAAALAAENSKLRMALFAAVIACFVVLMTGIAAALIQTRKMAQRIFVRHLHGWRFTRIYRPILIVEGIFLAGILAWIPWRVASQRRDLERLLATGAPLPFDLPTVTSQQWAAIAILALITSGGFLLSLSTAHRRIARFGATEA